jgi:tetratricopeptide (TPR) repeat protein
MLTLPAKKSGKGVLCSGHSRSWNLGKTLFDKGMAAGGASDFETALVHFRDAVRLAPHEPYPHYELGYTLCLIGQLEPALEEFRRTNQLVEGFFLAQTEIYMCEAVLSGLLDSESFFALRKIQRLTDEGQAQSPEAASLSRQVISRAPACALGHYYLGKALFASDPNASEEALRHCLTLAPDDTTAIDALTGIGSHRHAAGDADTARAIWSHVVARYKSNPHVKPTEAFFLQVFPQND